MSQANGHADVGNQGSAHFDDALELELSLSAWPRTSRARPIRRAEAKALKINATAGPRNSIKTFVPPASPAENG